MPNLIALAIPFFFLLIGVELWAANRRGLRLYRFADAIADLSCGMAQQIFLVFAVAVITGGYVWLYQYRLFSFGRTILQPVIGLSNWALTYRLEMQAAREAFDRRQLEASTAT